MRRRPYSIQKRSRKRGIVYYVQFWDEVHQRYGTAVSSGKTSKSDAEEWAKEQLAEKGVTLRKGSLTFREFATGFYDWDAPYIKALRIQKDIGRSHAKNMAGVLDHTLLPYFGDMKLSQITPEVIESWMASMVDEGKTRSTIRNYSQFLKNILSEARRLRHLTHNPMLDARRPTKSNRKRKGVMTVSEAKKLLEESQIETLWGKKRTGILFYTINLIAAGTGLRLSEIQALKFKTVNLQHRYIMIIGSWEREFGYKEHPKTDGSERVVPLSGRMVKYLTKLMPSGAPPEGFVFTARRKDAPVGQTAVGDRFRAACDALGIDRKARRITFHSWRHFFNSFLLNRGLPMSVAQDTIGHDTESMTLRYWHEDQDRIRQIQEELIDG